MATEWFLWSSGVWPLLYSCLPTLGFLLCICQPLSALNDPNQQPARVPQASCCVSPFSASQPLSWPKNVIVGETVLTVSVLPSLFHRRQRSPPWLQDRMLPFASREVVKMSGRGNSSSSPKQFWELGILMKCPPPPPRRQYLKNVFVSQETLYF